MGANVTLYLVAGSLWHSLAFGVKKATGLFLSLTEVQSGIIKRTFAARFSMVKLRCKGLGKALVNETRWISRTKNSLLIQCRITSRQLCGCQVTAVTLLNHFGLPMPAD